MISHPNSLPDTGDDVFAGLKYLIQYRRKDSGVHWNNMAAFDVLGATERYLRDQSRDEDWPWEYQMVDIESGTTTRQEPTP